MNTFIVLDTPPNQRALRQEPTTAYRSAMNLSGILSPGTILLKRDPLRDVMTLLRRVHNISSRRGGKGVRIRLDNIALQIDVADFSSHATSGDRVVVLGTQDWERFLVG